MVQLRSTHKCGINDQAYNFVIVYSLDKTSLLLALWSNVFYYEGLEVSLYLGKEYLRVILAILFYVIFVPKSFTNRKISHLILLEGGYMV